MNRAGSLLALSNRVAVRRQIAYATDLGLPWGISESQFNARDRNQNYQYSGFGVPDLGIKRGLGENTVIAPYASGLAAMIRPLDARKNLDRLSRMGALGVFGWYEAIDYTRARLPENASYAIIRSYMSHHQGMMILGIADAIFQGRMRERFHAEPMVKATELLLQERMPRDVVGRAPAAGDEDRRGHDLRRRTARAAQILQSEHARAAHQSAVQRRLQRDADRRRRRLQPLARDEHHSLAGGCDARSLGFVHLSARSAQRKGLVGRLPAGRSGRRQL